MPLTERELLDETIREARGMVKDLTREIKAARRVRDEVTDAAREAAEEVISEIVEAEVKKQIDLLGEETSEAIDAACERAQQTFEELTNVLLHGNRQGRGESVVDMAVRVGAVDMPDSEDAEEGSG